MAGTGAGWRMSRLTLRKRLFFIAVLVGALIFGFLTMQDPSPTHPVPEPSPAFTGNAGVPETSPIGPS